jgi:hypothetical protein
MHVMKSVQLGAAQSSMMFFHIVLGKEFGFIVLPAE